MMEEVTTAMVVICWVATMGLLFLYTTSKWWVNAIGRAFMIKTSGLSLLSTLAIMTELFGFEYPYRDQLRLTSFTLIAMGQLYLLITLGSIRIQERRTSGVPTMSERHGDTEEGANG